MKISQPKIWLVCCLLFVCLFYNDGLCQETNNQTNQFPFEILSGPQVINITDIGRVYLPEGFIFVGEEGTQAIMEMMGNPVSGMEVGYIEPDSAGAHNNLANVLKLQGRFKDAINHCQ